MRPQVGQLINNKYRLIRIIGDGGMGSVYAAQHELLGKTVALKFLHPELSKRSSLVERFLKEARISAQIQSPHVVHVTDVDQQQGGLAFIVMEYLEGKTLQTLYEDLYKASQRLSYADALEYAMQMLEGVEAAHAAEIVHRDLKPDNVIITKDKRGEPLLKLLDFGIAKLKVTGQMDRGLTRPGVVMGTPEYMAPEQAYSADTADLRADIFSLGVMIFEMLAGRRPVGGDDPQQIATAYMTGQIAKLTDLAPNIAPDLAAVVHKAMAAQPKDRFGSVAEFRSALEPFFRTAKGGSLTTPATPMPGHVTPAPAISPVASPSPLTPATNAPDEPEYRAVPKTIPPEEASAELSASLPPPVALPQGTPAGSFVVSQPDVAGAAVHNMSLSPMPPVAGVDLQASGLAAGGAAAALPSTVNAAPYVLGADGSAAPQGLPATVSAPPFSPHVGGGLPATSFDAPALNAQQRPGGTAVGASPSPYNGTAPAYPMVSPNVYSGLPGTATMSPVPAHAQQDTSRRKTGGVSVLAILLIAAGVSGVVMGGLYAAQRFLKPIGSEDDPTIASSQPTSPITADPGPTAAPSQNPLPPQTVPVVQSQPPVTTTPKPTSTWTGSTKPPATTTTTATPTANTSTIPPPVLPTSFPTIMIPTSFPTFTLPGTIPRPTMPQGQPTSTSPSSPTQPTTKTPRPRITIPQKQ